MKKIYLLLIVNIIFSFASHAQSPSWIWAKRPVSNSGDNANCVAKDASGNIYVAGAFNAASITFSSTVLSNASTGSSDIYIVKYDPSGNPIWAKRAGGSGTDQPLAITVDAAGNVLVVGYYASPSIVFGSSALTNIGSNDGFVAKYDANGNGIWAKSIEGFVDEYASCVTTDASNNVYVGGYYSSSTTSAGTFSVSNSSAFSYMFFVKYTSAGAEAWMKNGSAPQGAYCRGIAADASGNIYATGAFYGDPLTVGTTTVTNNNTSSVADAFLVKLSSSTGNTTWLTRPTGGSQDDIGWDICCDATGNVYVAGVFKSVTLTFGTSTLVNPGSGSDDIFAAKYSSAGTALWAKNTGGPNAESANGIALSPTGDVYVTGSFQSASFSFGSSTLNNTGGEDVYVIRYSSTGTEISAIQSTGTSLETASDLCLDASGNIYVVGFYGGSPASFGSNSLGTATGVFDSFVAKYGIAPATTISELVPESGFKIYPNPSSGSINIITQSEGYIEVYNALGEKISNNEIKNKHTELDISSQPSGIYFIRIGSEIKKIVKH